MAAEPRRAGAAPVENVWKRRAKPVEILTRENFLSRNRSGSRRRADVDERFAPGFA